MQTKEAKFQKFAREIFVQPLVLKIQQQGILFAMKNLLSFRKNELPDTCNFMLQLNLKQKLTRIKWVSLFKNLLKKIRHSRLKPILKQVKRLFQVWANFTLISLLTVCSEPLYCMVSPISAAHVLPPTMTGAPSVAATGV